MNFSGALSNWTIEGNGVYVVELTRGAAKYLGADFEPGYPCLYVGQSAHPPERRLWNHLNNAGSNSSEIVKRNAKRLRFDLFAHLPRFKTAELAKEAESAHAFRLAKLGFNAYFDGKHIRPRFEPDEDSERLREIDHLRAVEDYVDQSVFSVIGALRAQGCDPCDAVDQILTSGRPEGINPEVVISLERQFAYMRPGVVRERFLELKQDGFIS